MSEKIRIPFEFHVKKVECVSLEDAARLMQSRGPASGIRLGPNDAWSPISTELHASPELDSLMRKARRQYAGKREAEADRARIGRALANKAYLPRDIPPGASRPAAALYQNILPPRQASSSTVSASTGDEPQPDAAVPASQALSRPAQSLQRTLSIVRRMPSSIGGAASPVDASRASATPPTQYAANDKLIINPVTGLPERPLGEDQPLQSPIEKELQENNTLWPYGSSVQGNISSALARAIAQHGPGLRDEDFAKRKPSIISQQLKAEQAAGVRAPTKISSMSVHIHKQMEERDGGVGVNPDAVQDAFDNPLGITYAPTQYGPTFVFKGADAAVAINPEGTATTAWAKKRTGYKK